MELVAKRGRGRPRKDSNNEMHKSYSGLRQFNFYVPRLKQDKVYELVMGDWLNTEEVSISNIITKLLIKFLNGELRKELDFLLDEENLFVEEKKYLKKVVKQDADNHKKNHNLFVKLNQEQIDIFSQTFKLAKPQEIGKVLFYKILNGDIVIKYKPAEYLVEKFDK